VLAEIQDTSETMRRRRETLVDADCDKITGLQATAAPHEQTGSSVAWLHADETASSKV